MRTVPGTDAKARRIASLTAGKAMVIVAVKEGPSLIVGKARPIVVKWTGAKTPTVAKATLASAVRTVKVVRIAVKPANAAVVEP
jgi:hypothetical protein